VTRALAALLLVGAAAPAAALQPLQSFVAGARNASSDQRIARLRAVEAEAEALRALGGALPSLSARGVYTRNEFESQVAIGGPGGATVALQRRDELQASVQVDLAVLDAAGWARVSAGRARARASVRTAEGTRLAIEGQVASRYYDLVGAEALVRAGEQTLLAAERNVAASRARREFGAASDVDVDRAAAEVERARQSIAEARLSADLARRALVTLTGLTPDGEVPPFSDSLDEEAPFETWLAGAAASPSVLSAGARRAASDADALAARLTFVPTVTATAREQYASVAGLGGREASWVATLTATWKLDLGTVAGARAAGASARIAAVEEEAAMLEARDAVYESWARVRSGIVRCHAARAEAQAARSAAARARERRERSAGTELELVQAERDAFQADVSRVRADADLALSRANLRLKSGRSLSEEEHP
jgi:outer membrane protein